MLNNIDYDLSSIICSRSMACFHFCGSMPFVKMSATCSNVGQYSKSMSGLLISSWIDPRLTRCVRDKLLSLGEKPFFAILMVASLSSLIFSLSSRPATVCQKFSMGMPSSKKLWLKLTSSDSAVDLLVDVCFLDTHDRGKKVVGPAMQRNPPYVDLVSSRLPAKSAST